MKGITMLKRTLLAALLAVTVAAPAMAQDAKQNFQLVNRTGYELKAVFVSPSKVDSWGSDVMGQDTLDDSASVAIKFHPTVQTCKWDLKVIYSIDNTSAVWSDVDLCTIEKITIKYNKSTDTTSASFD